MNTSQRRSPRLARQIEPQQTQSSPPGSFPSFASLRSSNTSASTTSQPSPANTNDHLSLSQLQAQHQQQHSNISFSAFTAPLPSPSANNIDPFFSRQNPLQSQVMPQQQPSQRPMQPQTQFSNSSQAPNHTDHHNSFSQPDPRSYPPTSTDGIPPGLPPDFLAEAAKRAQMACLMRDLGDVTL